MALVMKQTCRSTGIAARTRTRCPSRHIPMAAVLTPLRGSPPRIRPIPSAPTAMRDKDPIPVSGPHGTPIRPKTSVKTATSSTVTVGPAPHTTMGS